MSYKFQVGAAVMSGSLTQEGAFVLKDDLTAGNTVFQVVRNNGVVSGSGQMHMVGNTSFGGGVAASGSVTAGSSFIIGAADLDETDMEKLDGITNGTAAASKAVVLDGSKNIATIGTVGCGAVTSTGASSLGSLSVGAMSSSAALQLVGVFNSIGAMASSGSITAGSSFIIGSADLNETDMEKLDGITNGTAAASKAVVLDGSKNIATIGTVGCGAITSTGASTMGSLGVGALSGSSTLQIVGAITSIGAIASSGSLTGVGVVAGGAISAATSIDGSGDLTMGTITMTGFSVDADGDTALKSLAVDNSSTIGCDADSDIMTLAAQSLVLANDVDFNVAKAGGLQIGGTSVSSTAAELNLVDDFQDATYAQAADSIVFFDATDSKFKRESNSDFLTAIAGAGISVSSNKLVVQSNAVTAIHSGQTCAEGYNFIAAAVTASHSIILPTSPTAGDVVTLKTNSGVTSANYVQLSSSVGDSSVDGENLIRIESPFGAVSVFCADATAGAVRWKIV